MRLRKATWLRVRWWTGQDCNGGADLRPKRRVADVEERVDGLTRFMLTAKASNQQHQRPSYTMAEEQAAHHLLNVLEERCLDANLDLDNVLAAFEDEHIKRDAAAWVAEYLHPDTLLTKEELDL